MNSTEPSLAAKSTLPFASHLQNYLFDSRKEKDLLALSQPDLASQLGMHYLTQNPLAANLAALQQNESLERLLMSQQARELSKNQMAELLAMSQYSVHDPYTSRVQSYGLPTQLYQKESLQAQAMKLNNEINHLPELYSQLNYGRQFPENLDYRSQGSINDLLLMQLKNNNMGMTNSRYEVPSMGQGSHMREYLPTQNPYMKQTSGEKAAHAIYHQGEYYENDLKKRQFESLQRGMKEAPTVIAHKQMYESAAQHLPFGGRNLEELYSTEQLLHPSQNRSKSDPQIVQAQPTKSTPPQIQIVQEHIEKAKPKQVPIEIIDDPEPEPVKETRQVEMSIENAIETGDSSTTGPESQIDFVAEKKQPLKCFNRLCLTDGLNEELWAKDKIQNSVICKNCLNAFNQGRFCCFCQQIYHDDETAALNDEKEWIECEACQTWNHIDCEVAENMKDLRILIQKDKNYKYYCPGCKKEAEKAQPKPVIKVSPQKPKAASPVQVQQPVEVEKESPPSLKRRLSETLNREEIVEPSIKKVLVLETTKVQYIERVQDEEDILRGEIARKKLESLFSKQKLKKKKFSKKVLEHVYENPFSIEKLLTYYGGKPLQLPEDQIRSDLLLFKELQSQNSLAKQKRLSNKKESDKKRPNGEGFSLSKNLL